MGMSSDVKLLGVFALGAIISFLFLAFGAEITAEVEDSISQDNDSQDVTGNITEGIKTGAGLASIMFLIGFMVVIFRMLRSAGKESK